MEKITQEQKDTMDMITMIASNGNPGALTTLMELQQSEGFQNFMSITDVLSKWGVRDSKIWILYSDCCNKDIKLFADVVKKMPEEYVIDHIGKNNQGYDRGKPIDPNEVNSKTKEINMPHGTWGGGREQDGSKKMRAEWLNEDEYERIKKRIEKITKENEEGNDYTYICNLTDLEKKIDKLSACYEIDIKYGREEDKDFILEETLKDFENFKFDNNLMTEEMEKQFAIEYFKQGYYDENVVRDIYNTDNGIEITINGKEVELTPDDLAKNHCSEELRRAYKTMHQYNVGDDMQTKALSEEVAEIEKSEYPYDDSEEEKKKEERAEARNDKGYPSEDPER